LRRRKPNRNFHYRIIKLHTVYTYETFVIKLNLYPNKQLVCLYCSSLTTMVSSSIKLSLLHLRTSVTKSFCFCLCGLKNPQMLENESINILRLFPRAQNNSLGSMKNRTPWRYIDPWKVQSFSCKSNDKKSNFGRQHSNG
jgi:hypothetical protein